MCVFFFKQKTAYEMLRSLVGSEMCIRDRGLIFAMAADYRIVKNHPKITIGMSEIKIGLPLSLAQSGVMRFGYDSDKKFTDLMYFGRMLNVNEAKDLAIVDEIVEEDQLMPRAKAVSYTHLRAHETPEHLVCRLLLEKKNTHNKPHRRQHL